MDKESDADDKESDAFEATSSIDFESDKSDESVTKCIFKLFYLRNFSIVFS